MYRILRKDVEDEIKSTSDKKEKNNKLRTLKKVGLNAKFIRTNLEDIKKNDESFNRLVLLRKNYKEISTLFTLKEKFREIMNYSQDRTSSEEKYEEWKGAVKSLSNKYDESKSFIKTETAFTNIYLITLRKDIQMAK